MENSAFNTVIVRDSRIQDISTKLDVVVQKGASTNTYQHFGAQSQSTSSVNFNIVVPSENVVLDREITWSSKPTVTITIAQNAVPTGAVCMSYGTTEALNQFPLNSLLQNSTVVINTQSINVSTQDIMHTLLRSTDDEIMSKYNCPHMSDKRFKKYSDMVLYESNPLGSYANAKGSVIPRGAHPVEFTAVRTVAGVVTTVTNFGNAPNTQAEIIAALTCSATATNSWVITLSYRSTEPLLFMSPFIYGANSNNSAGLYGVNNLGFTFSIDNSCKRMFCSSSSIPMTIALTSLEDNFLNCNFLTCQPSDLLNARNVVPLMEYTKVNTMHANISAGTSSQIVSNSLQLNQIPNRIFIVVRKPMSTQTIKDSNTFLAISKVNVNFNNLDGILSGGNVNDLYNMSVRNGSKQDMYEFLGKACVGQGISKATSGSILIINPALDLHCPDYLSNGSIGQFSFQFTVDVINTDSADVIPELLIITEYDGLFVTQSGQSFKQTSLLTKELVMNSTMAQFGESSNYVNSFGSGNGMNVGASSQLRNIPLMNQKKSGGAKSGGAESGGAFSGGAYSGGSFSASKYF